MSSRFARFALVGTVGFAIQLGVLAALVGIGWSWLPATVVAVECAIVHNFLWHERWTWGNRCAPFVLFGRFARFNASTAVTSIAGNVVLMGIFVEALRIPPVFANILAVGTTSLANFVLADRWVFVPAAAMAVMTATAASAAPAPETLDAWCQYVDRLERHVESARNVRPPWQPTGIEAAGDTIAVPAGTISHWRGAVFIGGTTVDRVLRRLQYPGTPPPQDDVIASRVTARGPSSLHVYMRLVRRALVAVTYDTEHDMTFRRWSPELATAASVSTRIDEVGEGDRGFLWRLNSYWRYEQVGNGVLVSVDSLTLSRDVPSVLKPVAGRIIPRIARESLFRTLEALRRYAANA